MDQIRGKWLLNIILLLVFSGVLVVYTAPTKHKYGDALVFVYLIGSVIWRFSRLKVSLASINAVLNAADSTKNILVEVFKWHSALFFQAVLFLCLWGGGIESEREFICKILWGVLAYIAAFSFSARFGIAEVGRFAGGALVAAGSVHLLYMCLDIWMAYSDGRLAFVGDPRWGVLEGIKDIPRVGRKHLSIAMVNLIAGSLILVALIPKIRFYFYFLAAVAAIALVVVDARSAYVSIFMAFIVVCLIKRRNVFALLIGRRLSGVKLMAVLSVMVLLSVMAYESGKSRWGFMAYSFEKAYEHVFVSTDPVAWRPYVDKEFWFTPISSTYDCYTNHEFRCEADPSAYLRMAWLLDGVKQVIANPYGVGGSSNYMGRIWGVEGDESKFQRVDSEFILFIVSYGVAGLFFYLMMFWSAMLLICRSSRVNIDWEVVLLSSVVLTFLVRGVFDTLSDGLWQCMLVLWGVTSGIQYFSLKVENPVEILNLPARNQ